MIDRDIFELKRLKKRWKELEKYWEERLQHGLANGYEQAANDLQFFIDEYERREKDEIDKRISQIENAACGKGCGIVFDKKEP